MPQNHTRPNKVLVVDDDVRIRDLLRRYLMQEGFEVMLAEDGKALNRVLQRESVDLIVLDLMMPGEDGLSICRRLRAKGDVTPIVMLTAKGEDVDRIVGLELGADDYVPKPFEPRELVARVQTVLRRRTATAPAAAKLEFDGLTVDPATRSVWRQGQPLELTGTEFDLLHLLAREPGKVFSRDDILNQLRGHEADLYTRAVDIVVSRLRKKLEPLDCIKTLRNAGYSLALRRLVP